MKMHQQGGVAGGVVRPNAGVDVSKHHLDVCVAQDARRVANDTEGWVELTAMFQAAQVDLVVVEATGGDERGLVCALQGAGVSAARHRYITPMLESAREVLAELMTRRRQLVDMRVAEHNRLEHAGKRAAGSIASVIKMLDKQIATVDRHIDDHMDHHFRSQRELLDSVKGVGPVAIMTKVAIVACMRKLLTILDAMLRDQALWDATRHIQPAPKA